MRKGWWRLWFPHKSGWDSGRKKEAKEAQIKKEAIRKEKAQTKKIKKIKKMREKERRGNVTIIFPHLCLKVAPCSSYRESLELSLSYTSGNFHYRTWLVYSDDGLPQNALGLHEQASWMHTHLVSFVELSYTYSSSASVAWQSLLTHIDIYWWASP